MEPHVIPNIYVMARILKALDLNGPTKKTNVQMLSRANYTTFAKYLKWMIKLGLIDLNDSKEELLITYKGSLMLARLSVILEDMKMLSSEMYV